MNVVDWNSEEHVQWMCEQAGIEFKGLPLPHHDRLKLLAIMQHHPFQEKPTDIKRRVKEIPMNPNENKQAVNLGNSIQVENALLGQYDKEIADLENKQTKYIKYIEESKVALKALKAKRARVAKVLATVGALCMALVAGCERDGLASHESMVDRGHVAAEDCTAVCQAAGGSLASVEVATGHHIAGVTCVCDMRGGQ